MRNPIKQLVLTFAFAVILSACGQGGTAAETSPLPEPEPYVAVVEPETLVAETPDPAQWWETHYRVIFGEPEENAENHLMRPGNLPFYLHAAFYGEDLTVELYTCDGVDSPVWSTLLVYKNESVYPLRSLAQNHVVWSITGGRLHGDEYYTIWAKTSGPDGFVFFEYTYDSEKGAFIETVTHVHILGTWPASAFNVRMDYSLEDL